VSETFWLEANVGLITAAVLLFFGHTLKSWLDNRRDLTERRRERYISHLIEAYRNLEDAAGRQVLTDKQKDRIESSVAAVFLFGSGEAAKEAKLLSEKTAAGQGSMLPLLKVIRNDLRKELGLEKHDVSPLILRMWRDEEKKI